MRAEFLRRHGYRVLVTSNGFVTMELCSGHPVDAVVLDLDRNFAEVALIVREIKRCRPEVLTIVLAESLAKAAAMRELADAMVQKEEHAELVKSLQELLTA